MSEINNSPTPTDLELQLDRQLTSQKMTSWGPTVIADIKKLVADIAPPKTKSRVGALHGFGFGVRRGDQPRVTFSLNRGGLLHRSPRRRRHGDLQRREQELLLANHVARWVEPLAIHAGDFARNG